MNGKEPVPEIHRIISRANNSARLIIAFTNPGLSTARYKGTGCIIELRQEEHKHRRNSYRVKAVCTAGELG